MKLHRSASLAGLLLAIAVPALAGDIKLELAVHEAARAARKQGFEKLLVVVREDLRSARDQEIGGVLRTLESQTVEALAAEPRVEPVTSRTARIKAHSAKARQAMTSLEFAAYRGDIDADAILNVDYQKRRSATVRMTLLDGAGVFFSETVRLSGRPEPDGDLFASATDALESDADGAAEPKEDNDKSSKSTAAGSQKSSSAAAAGGKSEKKQEYAPSAMRISRNSMNDGTRMLMRSSPRAEEIIAMIGALLTEAGHPPDCPCREHEGERDGERDGERGEDGERGRDAEGEGTERERRRCPRDSGDGERGEGGRGGKGGDGGGDQKGGDGGDEEAGDGGEGGGDTEEDETPEPLRFDLPPLNERVLNFAANNIGNRIGRGECWDLADQGLRAAGAEPARGYTYGDRVSVDEVMPGDILQFTSVRIDEPGYWVMMGTPNHTAVVQAVGEQRLFILQQNFDGKRYVTTFDFNPDNLTGGTLEAFRPRLPSRRR